ncbi:o-succinylbenzoate synthase [Bacillus suaedaesalsae]|uniref:o-succinylbenzoate synthase n=1 Tax=Bacillus suaedaesalsae TaxID=2810349 RepID=A0ABS2DHV4_9BACI|nr:o-succinylbenzoate synthase [Bacillus suaedaesalsae]MBM6618055.1 o-succinylbenzoate synthase [Bacillus suaedaesalsae]
MNIKSVTIYHIELNLISPFAASYGEMSTREALILEVMDESGQSGFGECVAFSLPWYTEETVKTAYHMLEDFLIPLLNKKTYSHPAEFVAEMKMFKRNNMAKASLEAALWDLYGKQQGKSLSELWGGTRKEIEAGVVVGLGTIEEMTSNIEQHLEEGYKRFKVKIKPGSDFVLLKQLREKFPSLPLMADANSAYTLKDIEMLKALDEFNLMMIEQPLASDDLIDHAELQRQMTTPICLDESIISSEDARKAIQLGSTKVINIKMGRVGGALEAINIHDICKIADVPVWCGGMLETGISRAHNIALASLPQFIIPGDISSSSRYWKKDIIQPEVKVINGKIKVPTTPGLGIEVDQEQLQHYSITKKAYQITT